jgi:hypothetical protein
MCFFSLLLFSLVDEEQGSGFVCLPPIGGDLCGVNGAAVDGICFGASDGSTACTLSHLIYALWLFIVIYHFLL